MQAEVTFGLNRMPCKTLSGISPDFSRLSQSWRYVAHVLLTRLPLRIPVAFPEGKLSGTDRTTCMPKPRRQRSFWARIKLVIKSYFYYRNPSFHGYLIFKEQFFNFIRDNRLPSETVEQSLASARDFQVSSECERQQKRHQTMPVTSSLYWLKMRYFSQTYNINISKNFPLYFNYTISTILLSSLFLFLFFSFGT